jgi:hypothetical protein
MLCTAWDLLASQQFGGRCCLRLFIGVLQRTWLTRLNLVSTNRAMFLIQILLPLSDDSGSQFGREEFDRVKQNLTQEFGGVTAYLQAPAEGLWQQGGKAAHDDIVVVEVMATNVDLASWRQRRSELERRFRQDKVIIRYSEISLV